MGDQSPPSFYLICRSTNCRSSQSNRSGLSSSKVQREVVSITLVHHFHTQTSTVENVCPSVQDATLTINDGLVEVESVQVECHSRDTKSSEPDTNHRPRSQEKVERATVVKGSILENQTTEVSMSSNDVIGLFFLTKLVTVVLGLSFSGFTNQ